MSSSAMRKIKKIRHARLCINIDFLMLLLYIEKDICCSLKNEDRRIPNKFAITVNNYTMY